MYSTSLKIGNSIAVYGSRASIGASSLAAMTASLLAAHGEKVLLLSTDADTPFDGVSLLSGEISDNYLDELIVLENNNGLTPKKLNDYVLYLTDNLGYLRASTKLTNLTKDAGKTIANILEIACFEFRYVILDIGFMHTFYAEDILNKVDMIIHVLSQDEKTLNKAKLLYDKSFCGNKFVVPIIPNFNSEMPISLKKIAKILSVDRVFSIQNNSELFKAVTDRNIATWVYKNSKPSNGLFSGLRKKNKTPEVTPLDELTEVCNLIQEALHFQERSE